MLLHKKTGIKDEQMQIFVTSVLRGTVQFKFCIVLFSNFCAERCSVFDVDVRKFDRG